MVHPFGVYGCVWTHEYAFAQCVCERVQKSISYALLIIPEMLCHDTIDFEGKPLRQYVTVKVPYDYTPNSNINNSHR